MIDKRCVCCQMLYEKFYDSKIYRLGSISSEDYRPNLFRKLSNVLKIEEAGNYYFFDGICKSLLSTGRIKEIMQEEELNIRNEHIIQKILTVYLRFYHILKNEIYFISTSFWYKNGKYYGSSADKSVERFLSLMSKNKNPENGIYELNMDQLNENVQDIWNLIK